MRLLRQSLVANKPHEAARTITALFHFTAIGIVDSVAKVGLRACGGLDQQQLVTSDAKVAVRQLPYLLRRQ